MSYSWEDLDDAQFERVVVEISKELFGIGVQSFSTGKDGGRDARFEGKAQIFPSTNEPWSGLTVIQAKHTNGVNAHFSDPRFSGEGNNSVLDQELAKIKKLVYEDGLNNYFLFSNRRLGANTNEKLKVRFASETGLDSKSIFFAGVEYLDDMLHRYPEALTRARILPTEGPLIASSYDLAEVILAIADELKVASDEIPATVVERVSYEDKNRINDMSQMFAKELSRRFMVYTSKIEEFLANPANAEFLELYESAVEEFQLKIIAKHDFNSSFDDLFNYLIDQLIKRDGVLARHKRLTRAMVFYMYWHCDIGKTEDVDSE